MKRHHELNWHSQCALARHLKEPAPMSAARRNARAAKRARLTYRKPYRKPYRYEFDVSDALLVIGVVIGALIYLDTLTPGVLS